MRQKLITLLSIILPVLFTNIVFYSAPVYAKHKKTLSHHHRRAHHLKISKHKSRKHHSAITVKQKKSILSYEDPKDSVKNGNKLNVNPHVMALALKAYQNALQRGYVKQKILTIIDYSLPSTTKRMWVVDLLNNKVLYHTLVAHGKHTGGLFAKHFSDTNGSQASSIGTFITANTYFGSKGYSLRLKGLEPGFNDKAFLRSIVLHGAWYATQDFARQHGRLGLSWGCPAVAPQLAKPIINQIKNGSMIFAYFPDSTWLQKSKFVGGMG